MSTSDARLIAPVRGTAMAGTRTAPADAATAVGRLHHEIAHMVAAALEAGPPTWDVTAPLLHDLLGPGWESARPVVLARAVGHRQVREASEIERALARADATAATALVGHLEHTERRLAAVLGR